MRVRDRIVELVPEDLAEGAMDAGLANLQGASLDKLTRSWLGTEDEAWN